MRSEETLLNPNGQKLKIEAGTTFVVPAFFDLSSTNKTSLIRHSEALVGMCVGKALGISLFEYVQVFWSAHDPTKMTRSNDVRVWGETVSN